MNISKDRVLKTIEQSVFAIRWMLVPLYIGLVASLGMYILHFIHEVFDMFLHMWSNTSEQNVLMLFILELVDMTMISQLVVMTIQGGYAIFIRPFDSDNHIVLPQWLKHGLGTSEQKIKLGMSIIGIMIVQLLKNFIEMKGLTSDELWMRIEILTCIIVSTLAFCIFNILMHLPMLSHRNDEKKDHH